MKDYKKEENYDDFIFNMLITDNQEDVQRYLEKQMPLFVKKEEQNERESKFHNAVLLQR